MKKSIIVHPILFAIFPILFLFSHNINQISMTSNKILLPITITTVFTLLLWSLLSLIFKDKKKAGLCVSLFLLIFFSYGHFWNLVLYVEIWGFTIRKRIFFPFWCMLYFLGNYFIIKTRRDLHGFTTYVNLFALSLLLISLINIGFHSLKTRDDLLAKKISQNIDPYPGDTVNLAGLPDIYYIILDAYARADILEEIYDYSNSNFINNLKSKGFYVANESKTNYANTMLAMTSNFHMGYINYISDILGSESIDYSALRQFIKKNNVFDFLASRGYKIIKIDSRTLNLKNYELNFLERLFLDEFNRLLLSYTMLAPLLTSPFDNIVRKKVLYTFDRTSEIAEIKGPKFVYAHIRSPHSPYLFGPHGEKTSYLARVRIAGKDRIKQLYLGQLIFISKKADILVDEILSKSAVPPIIILQSDHGPDNLVGSYEDPSEMFLKERMNILNAYYLPGDGKDVLYDSITPVNTFRIIFNYYFNESFDLLEDESYYSTPKHPFKFVKVAEK